MNDKAMNVDEIVRALRKAQEDYKNDIVSTGRIRIDAMARDCADLIESLKSQLAASQHRERAAVGTLTKLLKHADDDICAYCKNQIICNGKDCENYCEGIGDADGNYPDWKWTCEDFDYGTCFKMQDTPCNGCFDNDYSGFEWRGPQRAGEGATENG